jgi:hypothetical protein
MSLYAGIAGHCLTGTSSRDSSILSAIPTRGQDRGCACAKYVYCPRSSWGKRSSYSPSQATCIASTSDFLTTAKRATGSRASTDDLCCSQPMPSANCYCGHLAGSLALLAGSFRLPVTRHTPTISSHPRQSIIVSSPHPPRPLPYHATLLTYRITRSLDILNTHFIPHHTTPHSST